MTIHPMWMTLSLFLSTVALALPILVLFAAFVLSSRSTEDAEKISPFECGFDPKLSARIPFSLRFFLLAVLFLVFDIEIVLLLPIPISLSYFYASTSFSTFMFLIILIVGLLHEWREGSLEWSK